jgi:hypothetical protein
VLLTPENILVMKVGVHAREAWEAIVRRKQEEEALVGVTWWGYGGSVCHPRTQVQPFARGTVEGVTVVMLRTPHDFLGPPSVATEFSEDGSTWRPVPSGLRVTGSKYALVLRSLRASDDTIDLTAYDVGIGPMAGTPLSQYLRSRVDKACATLAREPLERAATAVALRADLTAPFAVLLR